MKHLRIFIPLLVLALILSGCAGETSRMPYDTNYSTGSREYSFTVDPAAGTITCGEDVYTYQVEKSGNRTSYVIDYPNGAIYHWTATESGGSGGWDDDYDPERYIPGDVLVHSLELNQPREKTGNVGIGLLLMGLGAANFFMPELGFYLRYGWAVRNAEPSDAYLTMAKIGGALAAVLGLVLCVV